MIEHDATLTMIARIQDRMPRPFFVLEATDHHGVPDLRYVYVNAAAAATFDFPLAGFWLSDLPAGGREAVAMYRDVLDSGEPHSSRVSYELQGVVRWFDVDRVPLDDHRVAVSFIDMTATLEEERRLEREREVLRLQIDQSPLAVSMVDVEAYRFVHANEAYRRMVGRAVHPGDTLRQVFPELTEDDRLFNMLDEVVESGRPFEVDGFPGVGFDAEGNPIEAVYQFTIQPIRDATGEIVLLQSVAMEVTGLHAAKERAEALSTRLDESQRRLLEAQRVGRVGVFEFDLRTRELTFSDDLRALYGLEPSTPLTTYDEWARHCHADDLKRVLESIERACESRLTLVEYEYRVRSGDTWRWLTGVDPSATTRTASPSRWWGPTTRSRSSRSPRRSLPGPSNGCARPSRTRPSAWPTSRWTAAGSPPTRA